MAKLTLTDVSAGYLSVATYNANNTLIETALENTLSRDGTAPNTMSANLDLNSNKLVNVTDGTNAQDAVTKAQLDGVATPTPEGTAILSTGVTDGYVLTADGANASAWEAIPAQTPEGTAIVATGVTDGYVLTADGANAAAWEAVTAPAPEGTAVLSTGPVTDGYVLTADGAGAAAWEAAPGVGGVTELVDLSDVTTSTKTNRNVLVANGTNFASRALVEADISDLGTYLTSYTETDTLANVTGRGATTATALTCSGGIAMADSVLGRTVLTDFGITSTTPTSTAATVIFNLTLSNAFQHTLDESITTTTISNPPASGTYGEFTVKFTQDATGGRTVAWPASVKWPGGTAPVIAAAAHDVSIVFLKTWDGGTTWFGDASLDYS
jgi:hypothetical protein